MKWKPKIHPKRFLKQYLEKPYQTTSEEETKSHPFNEYQISLIKQLSERNLIETLIQKY